MEAFALIVMMLGIHLARTDLTQVPPGDWVILAVFLLFLLWLLRERRRPADAAGHQKTGEDVAFRLGRALKRIVRPAHR